ncbi:peptidyl-prolyl cis-trans isomerase B-like [Glandiceps talaboti]
MYTKTLLCCVLVAICFKQITSVTYVGNEVKTTHLVYLDIEIDDEPVGTLLIALFGNIAPKTVKNFVVLSGIDARTFGYKLSTFHKIEKGVGIIGGDFVHGNGSGSFSIYGDHFTSENFKLKHYGPGWVSMVSKGKYRNGCIFRIITNETPELDDKQVVFGKVIEGMDVVHRIANLVTDDNGSPKVEVRIIRSGELKVNDETLDKYVYIKIYEDEDDIEESGGCARRDEAEEVAKKKIPGKEL